MRISESLYRVLLRLRYRGELRSRYGEQMVALFRRCLEEGADLGGARGWLRAWRDALADLARPLPGRIDAGPPRRPATPAKPTSLGASVRASEDVAFAWRSLRREPRFAALVVLVLGLGVALNATVFAVVNAYLIRPLPYPEADRIVSVRDARGVSYREVGEIFEKAGSWDLDAFTIVGDGRPELVRGAWVTTDFLELYGVEPALGRSFRSEESAEGAAAVTLISHRLWQGRYGGDPDVLGRTIRAYTSDRPDEAESFVVVGVLPSDFWHFNDYTDMLAPLRGDYNLYSGRLRPGVPLERARSFLDDLARSRMEVVPPDFEVTVTRTQDTLTRSVRPTLLVVQAAVLLVFFVACANAAVLLLVRSARRERELAVRRALGAGIGRLARQLLAEGLILAGAAGVTGALLGAVVLAGIREMVELPMWQNVPGGVASLRLDPTVLGALFLLSAVTGISFGLVPLLGVGQRALSATLGDNSRGATDPRSRRRLRAAMVAGEIGLSLALLTGAGLMVRSALNLQSTDLGFDPVGVTRTQVGLRLSSYPDGESRAAFFRALTERVAALPEAESVGLVSSVPFLWNFNGQPLETEDGRRSEAVAHYADGGYFRTMRIPLLAGRSFGPADVDGAVPVATVSRRVAESLWPGESPLGRRIRGAGDGMSGEPEPWVTVVGVVGDVEKRVGEPDPGDLYVPLAQSGTRWANLVVRRRGDAASLVAGVEGILGELDPEVPVSAVADLEEAVQGARAPSRFLAGILGAFAGLALFLAVVGLYGVMAYSARQQRREVAIRVALGAGRGAVSGWFVRASASVLAAGLLLGTVGGRVLGSALAGQLYGVQPGDPATSIAVVGLILATAAVAVVIPARRAARVNPATALREE